MLKKILAATLCLSMVLAFASCGSKDESSSKADSSKAETTTTTAAAEDDAADADTEEPAEDAETPAEDAETPAESETTDETAGGIDASAFVGTAWSATVIMDASQNAATIEDYCAGTGEDATTYAMTIQFTDETNCTLTTANGEEVGTWAFDGQYMAITDTDGKEQKFEFDATQNAFAFPISDSLALVLTQIA